MIKRNRAGMTITEVLIGVAVGSVVLAGAYRVLLSNNKYHSEQSTQNDLIQLERDILDALDPKACLLNFVDRAPTDYLTPAEASSGSITLYKKTTPTSDVLSTQPWITAGMKYGNTKIKKISLSLALATAADFNKYDLEIEADVPWSKVKVSKKVALTMQADKVTQKITSCSFAPDLAKATTTTTCNGYDSFPDPVTGACKSKFSVMKFAGPAYRRPSDGPFSCPTVDGNTGTLQRCECLHRALGPGSPASYVARSLSNPTAFMQYTSAGDPGDPLPVHVQRNYRHGGAAVLHTHGARLVIPQQGSGDCNCLWTATYPTSWPAAYSNGTVTDPTSVGCASSASPLDCFGHVVLSCSYQVGGTP